MLKKTITYEDFDGNQRTEDYYFNLTKAEAMELEVSVKGGYAEYLQNIVKENDNAGIISAIKDLILRSYGHKSEDGKRFVKTEEDAKEFAQSEAYSELFFELTSDDKAASDFFNGIIPKMPTDNLKAVK